jgi:hypothetical protein
MQVKAWQIRSSHIEEGRVRNRQHKCIMWRYHQVSGWVHSHMRQHVSSLPTPHSPSSLAHGEHKLGLSPPHPHPTSVAHREHNEASKQTTYLKAKSKVDGLRSVDVRGTTYREGQEHVLDKAHGKGDSYMLGKAPLEGTHGAVHVPWHYSRLTIIGIPDEH